VVVALALGALSAACFDSGDRPDKEPPGPPGPVEVDLTQAYQRIDGFGASSAWTATNISDALADQFFSPELGIGLSLLRVQIKPAGNTTELGTARKAAARGAKVWAAPWSPPAEWKDNGSTINGGSLLDEHRADWANRLATFASTMAAEGIPLVAISAQNEPNYEATWDTCLYTPAQLVTFVRDFLGPALAAQNLTVPPAIVKSCWRSLYFWLTATITMRPLAGSWNALRCRYCCDKGVAATRTKPGRTNRLQFPST